MREYKQLQAGDICPKCFQKVSAAAAKHKRELKVENWRQAVQKSKQAGTVFGRPSVCDRKAIHVLRKQGLSFRAIAKLLGYSYSTIQRTFQT